MSSQQANPNETTIAAIITPAGIGGISAVRLSGPGAFTVARCLLGTKQETMDFSPGASHKAHLVTLIDPTTGHHLDQVLLLPMHAPGTYTGEHTVEFFCHGGSMPAALVLEACLSAGARAAGPGEFTRRAFMNGRLSLDQAEAVADLIHAENKLGARAALGRLHSGLKHDLDSLEAPLLRLLSEIEGSLEFVDDDLVDVSRLHITSVLSAALVDLDQLLADSDASRRIRHGVQVVLAGPVNAGKSSLFNALLGWPRALVDAEAGTTRDVVSATLEIDGAVFVLHDTAGLRNDVGRVESAGIKLTHDAIATADLVLWLQPLDGVLDPTNELPENVTVLSVGTRSDLVRGTVDLGETGLRTSSETGEGLEDLCQAMSLAAGTGRMHEVAAAGRSLAARHQDKLTDCRTSLAGLLDIVNTGAPDEVLATELGYLLAQLGEVTGRVYSERLLGEIFSTFCVGK